MSADRSRARPALVFLLDVDNTLLDNDRLKSDLAETLEPLLGPEWSRRFWELYEQVRDEEDFVDFPTTIARLSREHGGPELAATLTAMLDDWPFARFLYPHVLATIDYLKTLGPAVILSDGDPVFQPLKIKKSGLWAAVDGEVMIFVHKELELLKVFDRYPADHYVVVDDKPRILSALERDCPTTFTTVLVMQGKYARTGEFSPDPDYVVPTIGDLRCMTREQFQSTARQALAVG